MKRLLLLLLAVFGSATAFALPGVQPALACSVGPDFDLVEDSDLIVAGRFTGWTVKDSGGFAQAFDPKQSGGMVLAYAGVRASMLVDRVFKGSAPSEITVTSGNTVNVYDHEPKYVWVGPNGACGAFGSDPTGVYAIMGLTAQDDGTYGASIFRWFYAGEVPPTEYSDRSLSRLSPLLPGYPPGASAPTGGDVFWPAVVLAVPSPLPFLAVLASMWLRENRQRMGGG